MSVALSTTGRYCTALWRVAHPVLVKKNLGEGAPSRPLLPGWGFRL